MIYARVILYSISFGVLTAFTWSANIARADEVSDRENELSGIQTEYNNLLNEEANLQRQFDANVRLKAQLDAFQSEHDAIIKIASDLQQKITLAQKNLADAVNAEKPDLAIVENFIVKTLAAIDGGAQQPDTLIADYQSIKTKTSTCDSSATIEYSRQIGAFAALVASDLPDRYQKAIENIPTDSKFDGIRGSAAQVLIAIKSLKDWSILAANAAAPFADIPPSCRVFKGLYPILSLSQVLAGIKQQQTDVGSIDIKAMLTPIDNAQASSIYTQTIRRFVKATASQFEYWLTLYQVDKAARIASTFDEMVRALLSKPDFDKHISSSDSAVLRKECLTIAENIHKIANERLGTLSSVKTMIKTRQRILTNNVSNLNSSPGISANTEWQTFVGELASIGITLNTMPVWPPEISDLPAAFAFDVKLSGAEAKLQTFHQ